MKYEKPTVINLKGHTTLGQSPLACTGGSAPAGGLCSTGSGATAGCLVGSSATGAECAAGTAPGAVGLCTTGSAV